MFRFVLLIGAFLLAPALAFALGGPTPAIDQVAPVIQGEGNASYDMSLDIPADITTGAPGDTIGQTTYDWWSNGPAKRMMVLSPEDGGIHLIWMGSSLANPWTDRHMMYNCFDPGLGDWTFGTGMAGGVAVQSVYRDGYGTLDLDSTNVPFVAEHRTLPADYPSSVAYDVGPYIGAFIAVDLQSAFPDSFIWPKISIDKDDIIHVFSQSNIGRNRIMYARSTDHGLTYSTWTEIDTMCYGWQNSAGSKQSATVAAIYTVAGDSNWAPTDRNNSLVILESYNSGVSFTRRTILLDLLNPSDTLNCMHWGGYGIYDLDDSLQVVTVATRPAGPGYYYPMAACNLWHYTPEYGLSLVAFYPWMYQTPAFNGLNGIYGNNQLIHMPSLGQDPVTGYLYCVWNEFPWYEEQGGFECGELFAARSTDGGQTWSFKQDLTNTHGESEVYPSLAQVVDGKMRILYEPDLVAGSYTQGDSPISFNPVLYYEHNIVDSDVSVVSIDSPPDAVTFGHSYTPKVTVQNNGSTPLSFSVSCQADYEGFCFYMDTQPVMNLAGGATVQVEFIPWVPDSAIQGYSGTFWACAGYAADTNYTDDCKSKSVLVGIEETFGGRTDPVKFALGESHPNPFKSSTNVRYQVSDAGRVSLVVYDVAGRALTTLVDQTLPRGSYIATWDGRDSSGLNASNGVYFYRLTSGGKVATSKMVLMK